MKKTILLLVSILLIFTGCEKKIDDGETTSTEKKEYLISLYEEAPEWTSFEDSEWTTVYKEETNRIKREEREVYTAKIWLDADSTYNLFEYVTETTITPKEYYTPWVIGEETTQQLDDGEFVELIDGYPISREDGYTPWVVGEETESQSSESDFIELVTGYPKVVEEYTDWVIGEETTERQDWDGITISLMADYPKDVLEYSDWVEEDLIILDEPENSYSIPVTALDGYIPESDTRELLPGYPYWSVCNSSEIINVYPNLPDAEVDYYGDGLAEYPKDIYCYVGYNSQSGITTELSIIRKKVHLKYRVREVLIDARVWRYKTREIIENTVYRYQTREEKFTNYYKYRTRSKVTGETSTSKEISWVTNIDLFSGEKTIVDNDYEKQVVNTYYTGNQKTESYEKGAYLSEHPVRYYENIEDIPDNLEMEKKITQYRYSYRENVEPKESIWIDSTELEKYINDGWIEEDSRIKE